MKQKKPKVTISELTIDVPKIKKNIWKNLKKLLKDSHDIKKENVNYIEIRICAGKEIFTLMYSGVEDEMLFASLNPNDNYKDYENK